MLKLLDRYIIQKFLVTFAFTIGLFTLIVIAIDVPEKIDDFIKYKPPLHIIIFEYYVFFVPWFFGIFGPIFVFLACVYFTSKIAQNTEIIAMLNSGMSFNRLLRPYMISAAILAAIFIFLNTQLIPISDKHRFIFEKQWLKFHKQTESGDIHVQMEPGSFLHMNTFNYLDSTGYNIFIERFENNRLAVRTTATRLAWNKEKDMWRLEGYKQRFFSEQGEEHIVQGDFKDTMLKLTPSEFIVQEKFISSMTNSELNDYIRIEREKGSQVSKYMVELYRRMAMPFSFFVLTLLAFSISSRKTRGGTGLALGVGLLITLSFLLAMQVFNTFGMSNLMPAWLAVWSPNILYFIVALFFAAKAPK